MVPSVGSRSPKPPGMVAGAPRRNAIVLLIYLLVLVIAASYLLRLL